MRIDTADAALQIRIGEKTWQMPSSAHIHLIIDGPIIELFSRAGVFAAAIPARPRPHDLSHRQCLHGLRIVTRARRSGSV